MPTEQPNAQKHAQPANVRPINKQKGREMLKDTFDNGSQVGQPNLECYGVHKDFPLIVLFVPSHYNFSGGGEW